MTRLRRIPLLRAVRAVSVCAAVVVPSMARGQDQPLAAPTDEKQVCIAAAEQGQSQRDDGKYRSARTSFLSCAQEHCPRVIAQSCTKWLRELDESAPTIVLGAKDERGDDLTDVKVTFDGVPFTTELDGKPLEADAGEHVLRFERERNQPVEQKLLLRAGEKARVVSVTMKSVGAPDQPQSASAGESAPATPAPEPALSTHHVLAGSLGVAAVAAAGVGVFFLLSSNREKSDAAGFRAGLGSSSCVNQSTAQCQSLNSDVTSQYNDMNLSTILFAGAGALAAGAIVTWLVWPKAEAPAPQTMGAIVPLRSGAALQVSGAF
ncbi:MAG TPA: hypothetical protein VEK07_22070 [Polyangiaceae bacterium]|nr:hypothetical protein [Polyangiaceae bacterium]